MDFKKLADQAKSAIDKRGGTDSLKQDFDELKNIASSKGSLADKAKEAVSAIKDPGETGGSVTPPPVSSSPEPNASTDPTPDPAAPAAEGQGKHDGEGHGGHRREQQ